MPLPTRFESYKDFVITANSVNLDSAKWTITGFIRPRGDESASEESFIHRGHFALSRDEADEQAMVYGKKLIDDRASR